MNQGAEGGDRMRRQWEQHVRQSRHVVDAVAIVVVLLVAALAFAAHFDASRRRAAGDTYYYLSQALEFAGVPQAQAQEQAGEVVCSELHRMHLRSPRQPDCTTYRVDPPERYVAIFTSRPGWPLLIAPFVGLLGPWTGAVTATFVFALLAAALVYVALRQVVGTVAAAGGAATFSVLGTGTWAAWILPEGAAYVGTALVLLGATGILRGSRIGLPVVAAALVLTYACKPANGATTSAALLLAGLVLVALPGGRRRAAILAGTGAAALAAWEGVSRLLHLPSLEDTLQDLATNHYARPDVPNPYAVLREMNRRLWTVQLDRWAGIPQPLPVIVLACLVCVVTLRRVGVVWALVALSAFGIAALHPLVSQYDRLIAPAWFAVSAAVAGMVCLLGRALPQWDLSTRASPGDGHDRQRRTVGVGPPQED